MGGGFGVTGFPSQMRGNGAIDDAQYLARDGRAAGKQEPQWIRHTGGAARGDLLPLQKR